jgi:hypothetical protein
MNRVYRLTLMLAIISWASATVIASVASTGGKAGQAWDEFWRKHGVVPSPPEGFLGTPPADLKVVNLTNGKLTDQAARRWARADWRRGRGDSWSVCHLRMDLVDAGVLGTPGLSGNSAFVVRERTTGTTSLSCPPLATLEKIGVIAVTHEMLRKHPDSGLTEYVIVSLSRGNGAVWTRNLPNGRQETIETHAKPGVLAWQLDTGEFHDDPVIGPVWYQAIGWSCGNSRPGTLDDICGLVQPN